jgi:hypothetical protein
MKFKLIIVLAITFFSVITKAQDFLSLRIDSNTIKNKCALIICLDDFNAGIAKKVVDCNLDSSFLNKSKIVVLKVNGLVKDLLFFDFELVNNFGNLKYTFCWNLEDDVFYKIKGFYSNDYDVLFTYLKGKGMKLNENYFRKKRVSVEGVDVFCLLELYNTKSKAKSKPVITEDDRRKFECLHHHYEPVIIH